jgi:hypothetical protein
MLSLSRTRQLNTRKTGSEHHGKPRSEPKEEREERTGNGWG